MPAARAGECACFVLRARGERGFHRANMDVCPGRRSRVGGSVCRRPRTPGFWGPLQRDAASTTPTTPGVSAGAGTSVGTSAGVGADGTTSSVGGSRPPSLFNGGGDSERDDAGAREPSPLGPGCRRTAGQGCLTWVTELGGRGRGGRGGGGGKPASTMSGVSDTTSFGPAAVLLTVADVARLQQWVRTDCAQACGGATDGSDRR